MKNLFLTISAIALAITMNSCNNEDSVVQSNEPQSAFPHSRSITAFNEDRSASTEIEISSDNKAFLDEYVGALNFVLVKKEDLQDIDATPEGESTEGESRSISIAIKSSIPEGYALTSKASTSDLRAHTIDYGYTTHVYVYPSRKCVIQFNGYSAKTVYPGSKHGHPANGKNTYKTVTVY